MMVTFANSTDSQKPPALCGAGFLVRNGGQAGKTIVLPVGTSLLGSDPSCTVPLAGAGVSPAHALLLQGAERTIIRSLSGDTWCNGRPIEEAQLQNNDLLTLGNLELQFLTKSLSVGSPVESAARTQPSASESATRPPISIDRVMLARMAQADDDGRRLKRTARRLRRRERNLRSLAHDLQRRCQAQTRWIALREADLEHSLAGLRALAQQSANKEAPAQIDTTQQVSQPVAVSAENAELHAALLAERERWAAEWSQAQSQLAELMQLIPAELAQLQQRQLEARLSNTALADQQGAQEHIAARCAALEQASSALQADMLRLESARQVLHADFQAGHDQLSRQIAGLSQQVERLTQAPPPAAQFSPVESQREEQPTAAQRHSIEDRLAGLRAEREAFEDQQRKDRAEQALSRHLGMLTQETQTIATENECLAVAADPPVGFIPPQPEPTIAPPQPAAVEALVDTVALPTHPAEQQIVVAPVAEVSPPLTTVAVEQPAPIATESPTAPESIAPVAPVEPAVAVAQQPVEHSAAMNADDSPTADGSPAATTEAPTADPFERLSRLLQKDGASARLASRGESSLTEERPAPVEEEPQSPSEAVSFAPPPPAPESAAEILRRLGREPKFDDDEPAERSASVMPTRRANPADEPAVLLGTSEPRRDEKFSRPSAAIEKPKAEAEEDSIDDYMARLLQRVRTVSNEVKSESSSRQQQSNSYSTPERRQEQPAVPQKTADEVDVERRKLEYVRRAAPESSNDLKNLREVANMQARQAIDTHARKRLTDVRGNKLLVAVLALVLTIALTCLNVLGYIDSYLGVAGSATVAILWGLQYLSIVLRTKVGTASAAPTKPAAVEDAK